MIIFWSLKIIDQSMTMSISSTFYFVLHHVVNLSVFFNYFLIKLSMINCFDDDDNLSNESSLSTRQDNWWRRVSRNSFRSRKEKLWIVMTEADRRIARKACKRESTCTFFRKWKVMKSETIFFDRCKNDLDINDCDEWFFWLLLSLLVFKKEIKLSATTLSAAQNDLISKHHFLTCLIVFKNSDIIFRMFVLIFFIKNLDVLRLNNWFNFIRIAEKFHIRRSIIALSIAEKIDAFIIIKKRRSKLNNFALNSTERYDSRRSEIFIKFRYIVSNFCFWFFENFFIILQTTINNIHNRFYI